MPGVPVEEVEETSKEGDSTEDSSYNPLPRSDPKPDPVILSSGSHSLTKRESTVNSQHNEASVEEDSPELGGFKRSYTLRVSNESKPH